MCYSGSCQYELSWSGECNKPSNVRCPIDEQPDEEDRAIPDIDEYIFI